SPASTTSVQKSIRALSPSSNRSLFPSTNAPSRTVRQSWKRVCRSTKPGTLSILVIAIPHSRSHSSAVHLDPFLTMMRLFLIIPPRWGTGAWRILGPDNSFSIEEELDHFHIVKCRFSTFTLIFMTCHGLISVIKPSIRKHMTGMLLSHVISQLLTTVSVYLDPYGEWETRGSGPG